MNPLLDYLELMAPYIPSAVKLVSDFYSAKSLTLEEKEKANKLIIDSKYEEFKELATAVIEREKNISVEQLSKDQVEFLSHLFFNDVVSESMSEENNFKVYTFNINLQRMEIELRVLRK